jgi:hypothetical protein
MPPRDYSFQPDETMSGLEAGYDGTIQGLSQGYGFVRGLKNDAQDDEKRKILLKILQQNQQMEMDQAGYGTSGKMPTDPGMSAGIQQGDQGYRPQESPAINPALQSTPDKSLTPVPAMGGNVIQGGIPAEIVARHATRTSPNAAAPATPLNPGGVDSSAGPNPGNASGTVNADQNKPTFWQKVGGALKTFANGGYEGLGNIEMPVKNHPAHDEVLQTSKQGSEMDVEKYRQGAETERERMRDAVLREQGNKSAQMEGVRTAGEIMDSMERNLLIAHNNTLEAQKKTQETQAQFAGRFPNSKDLAGDYARYQQDMQNAYQQAQKDEFAAQAKYVRAQQDMTRSPGSLIRPSEPEPAGDPMQAVHELDAQWKRDQANIPAENKTRAHAAYMKARAALMAKATGKGLAKTPTQR